MTRRFARHRALLATSLLLVFAVPASSATLLGVEALQTWNLIIFGDVRSGSSVEGRGFVGGNLRSDGASYHVGTDGKGGGMEGEVKTGEVKGGEAAHGVEGEGFVTDAGKDPGKLLIFPG